jgi:tetratricopeptide (TPR) repeat protein
MGSLKKTLSAALLALTTIAFLLRIVLAAPEGPHPFQTINQALRAGQYDEALRLTAEALQKSPSEPWLYVLKGIALAAKGSVEEARIAYGHALQLDPNYVPALEGAAQLEYQADSDRALPLLKRLLALKPGDPTAQAMMGALAYKRRDCATAIRYFQLTNPVVGSNPNALGEYGVCLVKMNHPDTAIAVFRRLLSLRPDNRYARLALADVQYMTKHPEEAIATLQPLLESGDPDPNALMLASTVYEASGDTPRAVSELRQAITASPGNVELYLQFSDLSLAHRSFQAGIAMLDAGLVQLPNAASLYIARGILYVQVADYDKAQADFDTANRLEPDQAINSGVEGLVQIQKNDLDRALLTVRNQLKQSRNSAYPHYLLADTLVRRGSAPGTPEFQEAEQAAVRAIQLEPTLTVARDVLADLYLHSGRVSQAIEQSRLALAEDPNDQSAIYHLIVALRTTRDSNKEEIQRLVKQLAELQEYERKQEADRNRFKLIVPTSDLTGSTPH